MGVVSNGYGWLGEAGMEVEVGRHAGRSHEGCWHVRRCRSTSRVRGENTDDTRSHRFSEVQVWAGSSRNSSSDRSSDEGLNTGRHEKAPVRYPCSRLATLHGAVRTFVSR